MKPILFNTDMVRAIQNGTKTVTRRVVNPQPRMIYHDGKLQDSGDNAHDGTPLFVLIAEGQNGALEQIVPPYRPGDILYVRETWCENGDYELYPFETERFWYKADSPDRVLPTPEWFCGWCPSIHMPREAARIFLRVTDVRTERLQDIDDYGVVAEGFEIGAPFDELWDSTIKKANRDLYGWEANPWVWVIEFERCDKPKEES